MKLRPVQQKLETGPSHGRTSIAALIVPAAETTANRSHFLKCPDPVSKSLRTETVEWRDLVALTSLEKAWELSLGLPWFGLSLWCYGHDWWPAGLACSFYVFLTGLRQSHNAQHYCLGLPRRIQDGFLFGLSTLMLASMHA